MLFRQKSKFAAVLLTTCWTVLLAVPGIPAHAANASQSADGEAVTVNRDVTTVAGLCEHHTEHTAECLTGTLCSHAHTQDCYRQTTRCVHVHSGACGKRSTSYRDCTHVCSEAGGCIISGLECHHEHNDDCYYEEGSTCGYSCGSCHETRQDSVTSGNACNSRKSHHGSHHSRRRHC